MIFFKLLTIAVRNLRRHARRSIVTGLAIVIGAALMFLTGAIGDGMARQLIRSIGLAKFGGHMTVSSVHKQVDYSDPMDVPAVEEELFINDPDQVVDLIAPMDNVQAVGKRLTFWGLLVSPEKSEYRTFPGNLVGMEPTKEPFLETVILRHQGSFLPVDNDDVIYLGRLLSDELNLHVGEQVLVSVQNLAGNLVSRKLTIVGIFDTSTELNSIAYMPFNTAAGLLETNGRPTELVVSLNDSGQAAELADQLQTQFATRQLPVKAEPWETTTAFYQGLIAGNQAVVMIMRVILAAVIVVGIMNTSLMTVQERTREIGTLMALGYQRRHILLLFVQETLLLGCVAAAIGILVGVGMGTAFSTLNITIDDPIFSMWTASKQFNLVITATNLWLTLGLTLVASFLASLYPAFLASGRQPVEALAHV